MKFNISIMKLIIRLLILLILIVMLGIISAFLYSAKYWPDVYNYVNANITIKRIPKLSEVENLTIFEETTDTTIDIYETTEYITTDMYEKDYISFDDFEYKKRKRSIEIEEERDYSDVASNAVIVDYEFHLEDMLVDIRDSVDETKLTTSDMSDVEMVPKVYNNKRNLRYFGPPVNIFHKPNNDTNIYVRTIVIKDFDNIEEEMLTENSIKNLNLTSPILEAKKIEIIPIKVNDNLKNEKKTINILEKDEYNKKVRENEIPDTEFDINYDTADDNSTDYPIIDYVELYKDTTNEYIEIMVEATTVGNIETRDEILYTANNNSHIEENRLETRNVSQALFPWVAAIFVKNDTSDQFDYYCDGAVVSKKIIVTAARCLQYYGTWAKAENLLVLLGKTSLRTINENEMAVKIKEVIIHENFTMEADNDIAILVTETATEVQAGFSEGDFKEAYTTGWAVTGELTLISFDKEKNVACEGLPRNSFCAVYDNDITVCPSYGGIFAVRQADTWFLRGIRNGDPSDRSFCTEHSVLFTDVTYYLDWINMYTQ